jgi:hypothetical protein
MSDNVGYTPGSGATIAADNVGGALHQRVKLIHGVDGTNAGDVAETNPLPVTRPPLLITGAAAQTAVVNNILPSVSGASGTATDNFRSGSVQVVSTGTGGSFIFEQSNDGTNWVGLPVFNVTSASFAIVASSITASSSAIIYVFSIQSRFIRLRINATITGGSIQAFTRLSADPHAAHIQTVAQGAAANLNVAVGSLPSLVAGSNRIGFVATAGIQYDDSSTVLAANATFTGTGRDATASAGAAPFAGPSVYAQEVRAVAESDVSGTLWLEISRDNTTWRRIRSVATTAITGGGQAAELIYLPSTRYWRIGYTNGATIQARFLIQTLATAA